MDRHDFIRHSMILEEMEEEEKKNAENKKGRANEARHAGGGWPAGVRLLSGDPDDIEW